MTKVRRFRKKPLVVEAMEWDGTVEGATHVINWVLGHDGTATYHDYKLVGRGIETNPVIKLMTLEGTMSVNSGDFVIKGLSGEFYPHSGRFFYEAYDEVTDEN